MVRHSPTLLILILLVSCVKEKEPEPEEKHRVSYEIIEPISKNEVEKLYQIHNFEFHLPVLFSVKKSVGPDFTVYYIKYPAGTYGGLYFGQYPSLPTRIKDLTSKHPMYEEMKTYKGDPFRLNGPSDSLELNNFYKEKFENVTEHPVVNTHWFQKIYQELDFMSITTEEREKYTLRDSFYLEAIKTDSSYVWKSYPLEGQSGSYDVLFTDNAEYGWRVHLFTQVNKFTTLEKIDKFVDELVESKTNRNRN